MSAPSASASVTKRKGKELDRLKKLSLAVDGIQAAQDTKAEDDTWSVFIQGGLLGAWRRGVFEVLVEFEGVSYPYEAPRFRFKDPLFHPNILPDGSIPLRMLADGWSS